MYVENISASARNVQLVSYMSVNWVLFTSVVFISYIYCSS